MRIQLSVRLKFIGADTRCCRLLSLGPSSLSHAGLLTPLINMETQTAGPPKAHLWKKRESMSTCMCDVVAHKKCIGALYVYSRTVRAKGCSGLLSQKNMSFNLWEHVIIVQLVALVGPELCVVAPCCN